MSRNGPRAVTGLKPCCWSRFYSFRFRGDRRVMLFVIVGKRFRRRRRRPPGWFQTRLPFLRRARGQIVLVSVRTVFIRCGRWGGRRWWWRRVGRRRRLRVKRRLMPFNVFLMRRVDRRPSIRKFRSRIPPIASLLVSRRVGLVMTLRRRFNPLVMVRGRRRVRFLRRRLLLRLRRRRIGVRLLLFVRPRFQRRVPRGRLVAPSVLFLTFRKWKRVNLMVLLKKLLVVNGRRLFISVRRKLLLFLRRLVVLLRKRVPGLGPRFRLVDFLFRRLLIRTRFQLFRRVVRLFRVVRLTRVLPLFPRNIFVSRVR